MVGGERTISKEILDKIDFEPRGKFIESVVNTLRNEKNHKGVLSVDEILDTIEDPAFRKLGDEGTGKVVTSIVARTRAKGDAGRNVSLLMSDTLEQGGETLNGFPHAIYVNQREGKTDLVFAAYENSADGNLIYMPNLEPGKKGFGQTQQQTTRQTRGGRGLRSRRLAGRVYTEGGNYWQKSEATYIGARHARLTRYFADKYSDVMLLQQDIEVFKGDRVPESQDFEMAIDLVYGKTRQDMELLEAEIQKIGDVLKKGKFKGIDELSDLLYALHARERNEKIKSKRPDLESGSGMTNEEAEAIINELGGNPVLMEQLTLYTPFLKTQDRP